MSSSTSESSAARARVAGRPRPVPVLRGLLLVVAFAAISAGAFAQHFKAGYAERDITPSADMPMWGYAARRHIPSDGALDPLLAKCVVIDAGDAKVAIMGLDIGRGPRYDQMPRIRQAAREKAGVDFVLISGSHSHHGPVLELRNEEGKGKGKYDQAWQWADEFEAKVIEAIVEAAGNVVDAKIGVGSARVPLCRNRHTKYQPKPVDDELSVIRLETLEGKPIAHVVNFSAHPTILPVMLRKYSAEFPGRMRRVVEPATGAPCVFMQGSAGDLSPNTTEITWKIVEEMKAADAAKAAKGEAVDPLYERNPDIYTIDAFGKQLGDEVLKIVAGIQTAVPAAPSVTGMESEFEFDSRIDFNDRKILFAFELAFFRELVQAFAAEFAGNKVHPQLTTVLLNGDLALVGGSGEFFSNHSNRLKERSRVKTLFFGYCNGHHFYFPTIEAAAEGGYGSEPSGMSMVEVGAGEEMMNRALIDLYAMRGAFQQQVLPESK